MIVESLTALAKQRHRISKRARQISRDDRFSRKLYAGILRDNRKATQRILAEV